MDVVAKYKARLDSIQPPLLLISLVGISIILILASFPLHIAFLTPNVSGRAGREVGYLPAINWSIGIGLLAPAMIFLCISAYQNIPGTLDSLVESKMIVDSRWVPLSANELRGTWEATLRRCVLGPSLFLTILILLICLAEWVATSARPLITGAYTVAAENELDWSIGALLNGNGSVAFMRVANALFSLICFLLQALAASCLIQFYLMCFAFAVFIQGARIIPSVQSRNKRRGFENFEPFLVNVLLAGIFACLLFYSSRLQNAYLHSERGDTSLLSFVVPDVLTGAQAGEKGIDWNHIIQSAFSDYSSAMVFVGGVVVVFGTLFIVFIVLRGSALEGKMRLQHQLEIQAINPAILGAPSTEDAITKLEGMNVWPLEYPSLNTLFVLSMLVILSLFLYRIGLLVAGVALAAAARKFFKLKREQSDGDG